MSRPIFLIGYMGCGKTTLGRAAARAMGREFIDLDFYIEQRFRASTTEIFRDRGEEEFRRMEAAMLREAGEFDDTVIACGGGTPCFGDNMEYMNSRGITVWLRTSEACLLDRLVKGAHRRPLLAGKTPDEILAFMRRHLEERTPSYAKAKATFPGDLLENRAQIASSVREFTDRFGKKE